MRGAAILEDQHWLTQLWEHTSDAMAVSDEAGVVLAANPAYYRLYGYGPDEVIGRSFAIIFRSEQRAGAQLQYREIFAAAAAPEVVQSTVINKDGQERIVEARASFVEEDGRRTAILSIIRDVTEEVLARRDATRAQRDLRTFLFSLSHDIKSPIAVVKGQAQVLRRLMDRGGESLSRERLAAGLAQIEASAGSVAALVDELVEVTIVQDGDSVPLHLAPLDFVALVREMVERHQRLADQHQFVVETRVDSLPGVWDEARLARVLDNLLGNAIKYSPEGGLISVCVRRMGDGVFLSIEDNGIGIAPDDLPHVFDRFHRGGNVPSAVVGSGIGLASVQQIVQQHGGRVDITSGLGCGTRVTVWLPLNAPQRSEQPAARERPHTADRPSLANGAST